jgi:hypothetical protein
MKFCGSPFGEINSMSPRSGPGGPHSPLYSQSLTNSLNSSQNSDIHKLQTDVQSYKTKLEHWEQAYNQAKAVSDFVFCCIEVSSSYLKIFSSHIRQLLVFEKENKDLVIISIRIQRIKNQ